MKNDELQTWNGKIGTYMRRCQSNFWIWKATVVNDAGAEVGWGKRQFGWTLVERGFVGCVVLYNRYTLQLSSLLFQFHELLIPVTEVDCSCAWICCASPLFPLAACQKSCTCVVPGHFRQKSRLNHTDIIGHFFFASFWRCNECLFCLLWSFPHCLISHFPGLNMDIAQRNELVSRYHIKPWSSRRLEAM